MPLTHYIPAAALFALELGWHGGHVTPVSLIPDGAGTVLAHDPDHPAPDASPPACANEWIPHQRSIKRQHCT